LSQPSTKVPTIEVVTDELHEVLLKTGIADGPMILVGSSLGAVVVAHYIQIHPHNIIAAVLDDPPHLLSPTGPLVSSFRQLATLFYFVAYFGEMGFLRPFWYFESFLPLDKRVFAPAPGGQHFDAVQVDLTPYGSILSGRPNGHISGMYKETVHAIQQATEGSNLTDLYYKLCTDVNELKIVHFLLHPHFGKVGVFDWYNLHEVNREWNDSRKQLKQVVGSFSSSGRCKCDYIEESIHLWMWTNLNDFADLILTTLDKSYQFN